MYYKDMKSYKEFEKRYIGTSDIATLILVGCGENGLNLQELHFGEDNSYQAYICTENNVEIGEHYKKVSEFSHWLKIYDDEEKVIEFNADKITVYRAAMMGCIIHLINNESEVAHE